VTTTPIEPVPRPRMIAALLIALASPATAGAAPAPDCDRACLEQVADHYWSALLSHDPARLHGAAGLRFTENGVALQPGEGLWHSVSGTRSTPLTFADPARGVVVTSGVVLEGERPALAIARLVVSAGAVSGIESLVARRETSPFLAPEGWSRARDLLLQPLAPAARGSRGQLERIAESYFDRLTATTSPLPAFDERCNRVENGVQTTNNPDPFPGVHPAPLSPKVSRLSCAAQFTLGTLSFVSRVREPRYVLADESRGLVLAFATFDHDGGLPPAAGSPHGTLSAGLPSPYSYLVAELFKVDAGRIRHIQAIITQVPYGMRSPWP
jgi:hypothetical protein